LETAADAFPDMGNNGGYVMGTLPRGVGIIKRDEALADAHLIQCITAACRSQAGGAECQAPYRSGSLFYCPTIFFAAFGLPRPCFLKRIMAAVFARVPSSSGVLDSLGVIDSGTGFPRRLAISAQNFTNSGRGFFLRIA
jgi:hypothetical protein